MDASVRAALAKWPNVPDCHGWLSLDERGRWRMQGEPITNRNLSDFIGRNYFQDSDGAGDWIFQNGPQKVHVALALTPFVFHVPNPDEYPLPLRSHTDVNVTTVTEVCLDESGAIILNTDIGVGLLDDRDLPVLMEFFENAVGKKLSDTELANAIEGVYSGKSASLWLGRGDVPLEVLPIERADVPEHFNYLRVANG